jgi:hypothetical protein
MMRLMISSRVRVLVLTMAVWLPAALPARAGSLPPRAEVGLTSGIDVAEFRQVVSSRYHVHFRVVVAADIDHDGDLDVLASTDHGVTVWVNDGAGHLKVRRLPRRTVIAPQAPGNAWRDGEHRVEPTIQVGGSPTPVLVARAHAPPVPAVGATRISGIGPPAASSQRRSSPRAPPA